jgi:hypothetical protein
MEVTQIRPGLGSRGVRSDWQFALGVPRGLQHPVCTPDRDVEEPSAPIVSNAGAGDADGEMCFTGACVVNQHEIALVIKEIGVS